MKSFATLLLVALILPAGPARAQAPQPPMDSVALEAATRAVASQLRCVVCQGLSIQDSPSGLAQDMRRTVREMLAEGRTPEEVKAYFVSAYGEFVLLEPAPTGFNLAVYVLPVLALLGGIIALVLIARRWTARSAEDRAPPPGISAEDPDLAPWDELAPR